MFWFFVVMMTAGVSMMFGCILFKVYEQGYAQGYSDGLMRLPSEVSRG